MDKGFVDSRVHFLRVEGLASEFEVLGTSILAHLMALPGLFSKKESADAEDLVSEFGRFRILWDARRSVGNAANAFPGLETKVDVIFCEMDAEPVYRFAVLASLKANREAFLRDNVRQDFDAFPLDLRNL